jgi:hypothetical protein
MHRCNQINQKLCVFINEKNHKWYLKIKLEKLRDICRSWYLISQDEIFTRLCLVNLFIRVIFFIQLKDNKNRDTN